MSRPEQSGSTPRDGHRQAAGRLVLGWKEYVELPQWDLGLRAKLDTGARSSALHVADLEPFDFDAEGTPRRVRFDVVLGTRKRPEHHPVEAPLVGMRSVRDTGARAELRPVVRTRIRCGPLETTANVTLTSRAGMNFRMLLGRLTLEGHCLVDPQHGYLHTQPPKRARRTVAR